MRHAPASARIMAGSADKNASLFKRIGVPLGDPAAWVELDNSLELEQNPVLSPSELTSIIDSIKTILK